MWLSLECTDVNSCNCNHITMGAWYVCNALRGFIQRVVVILKAKYVVFSSALAMIRFSCNVVYVIFLNVCSLSVVILEQWWIQITCCSWNEIRGYYLFVYLEYYMNIPIYTSITTINPTLLILSFFHTHNRNVFMFVTSICDISFFCTV